MTTVNFSWGNRESCEINPCNPPPCSTTAISLYFRNPSPYPYSPSGGVCPLFNLTEVKASAKLLSFNTFPLYNASFQRNRSPTVEYNAPAAPAHDISQFNALSYLPPGFM